jgi:hypothetical protein
MQNGQRTTNLLSREVLKEMVDDLIRLCDGIERHGLVDYGVGVWEERIVEGMLLMRLCRDISLISIQYLLIVCSSSPTTTTMITVAHRAETHTRLLHPISWVIA